MRFLTQKGSLLFKMMTLVVAVVLAQTVHSQGLLYSGFENAVPPAPPPGWSVSHTGNANWQSLKNFMGAGNALKGQKCMYLANSYYGDQSDAWLYTPKLHLESGKKYSISFYYKNQVNGSNTMQVSLGNDTLPASQTEVIWNNKFGNIFYEEAQINYTATSTADKVLAFHCITPKTSVYIYIDEVTIKAVSCFEPLNVSFNNVTTSSVDFLWDAVDGTSGYVYGVSDTLTPPKKVQRTANTKTTVSGLKSGKKYYLYVKSACSETQGSEWAVKEFYTSYDASVIETISCGQVVANNFFRATEGLYSDSYCGTIYTGREFFHRFTALSSGYYNFDVFSVNTGQTMKFMYKEGSDASPYGWNCILQNVGDFGDKARFGPLEAGKEYVIMEKALASPGFPSSYSFGIECYAKQPGNDSCQNPQLYVPMPYNDTAKGDYLNTIGATASNDLKVNYNECGYGNITDDEVWVKFTANSDQELFRINNLSYNNFNLPSSTPGFYFDIFSNPCDLKSLVDCGYIDALPKNVKEFYSYKLKKGRTYYARIFTADQFTYVKFRMSIMPLDISKGTANQCTAFFPYIIDPYTDRNNTDEWVPLTDNAYKLVTFVNANGNTLDNINGGFYLNDGVLRQDAKGVYYLDRNVTISPSTQPPTPVRVRILISNDELNKLINQPGSGVSSIKDIRVTQNDDNCAPAFSGVYRAFITPSVAKDFDENYKMIEFEASSLSSFYLHGGNQPLSATAAYATTANELKTEINSKLIVYPNPAKSKFNISFSAVKTEQCHISITNMQGKQLKAFAQDSFEGLNQVSVDASTLPAGMYIIKLERQGNIQYAKVMKQ